MKIELSIIAATMALAFVTGCTQNVTPEMYNSASQVCEPNSGILDIRVTYQDYIVQCKNNAYFHLVRKDS